MNKLGIWAIVIAAAFVVGVLSANPVVEAAAGWKATVADLQDQIDEIELLPGTQGEKGDKGDKGDAGMDAISSVRIETNSTIIHQGEFFGDLREGFAGNLGSEGLWPEPLNSAVIANNHLEIVCTDGFVTERLLKIYTDVDFAQLQADVRAGVGQIDNRERGVVITTTSENFPNTPNTFNINDPQKSLLRHVHIVEDIRLFGGQTNSPRAVAPYDIELTAELLCLRIP